MRVAGRTKSLFYCAAFFVLSQLVLELAMPLEVAYRDRVDFTILKDNPQYMSCVLDLLKRTIERRRIREYFIVLGDSVAYSGPGGHEQSISRYMSEAARAEGGPPVFNLAVPAAQPGDYYTLLLMMEEKGISTENVILNIIYGQFVDRGEKAAPVRWFDYDLRRLDPDAYGAVAEKIRKARAVSAGSRLALFKEDVSRFLHYEVFSLIPVLENRGFLKDAVLKAAGVPEKAGDTRPWYEKLYLRELLKAWEYQLLFDPKPLVLDESNPAVFFMKKIAERQRGKNLFVFLSPVNSELMKEEVSRPGYRKNVRALDGFMSSLAESYSFHYRDLSDAVPQEFFCDHLHLTGEGYRMLADVLWEWVRPAARRTSGDWERRRSKWGFTRLSSLYCS